MSGKEAERLMALIDVRLAEVFRWNLRDHAGPEMVGSVSVDAQSACVVSMRQGDLVLESMFGRVESVSFHLRPASSGEGEPVDGGLFSTACFGVDRLHEV